jgi:hypothetical protein
MPMVRERSIECFTHDILYSFIIGTIGADVMSGLMRRFVAGIIPCSKIIQTFPPSGEHQNKTNNRNKVNVNKRVANKMGFVTSSTINSLKDRAYNVCESHVKSIVHLYSKQGELVTYFVHYP